MTGNAINAKSEALKKNELSSEDAVSGGNKEDKEQAEALKEFQAVLTKAGQI